MNSLVILVRRVGQPRDVANVICFLAIIPPRITSLSIAP
jgi:hypothetical protein